MNADIIDDISKKLTALLPENVQLLRDDLHKNVQQAVQAGLAKFDLVTREEFDVQSQVLIKTRQQLKALEARVAELEQK